MTTDNKDCSGCKWYTFSNVIRAVCCTCPKVSTFSIGHNRSIHGDCGPSAKYYEPKEQQP